MRPLVTAVTVTAAALVLALAGPAAAEPRFLQPLVLSDPAPSGFAESMGNLSLAMGAGGDAVAAWVLNGQVLDPGALDHALRPSGMPFGTRRSVVPTNPLADIRIVRADVGADGAAAIAFTGCAGTPCTAKHLSVLLRRPGAPEFGAPIPIQSNGPLGVQQTALDVAVTPDGGAIVAWTEAPSPPAEVLKAVRVRPDGTVGTIFTLSDPARDAFIDASGINARRILVDGRGNALIHWSEGDAGAFGVNDSAFFTWWPANGAPEAATRLELAATDRVEVQAAAMDGEGNVVFALQRVGQHCLFEAFRPAGPGKAAVAAEDAVVCLPVSPPYDVRLGVDGAGAFTLAYAAAEAVDRYRVFVATRPAGAAGRFGTPVAIDAPGAGERVEHVELAVGPDGRAIVVWHRAGGPVQASVRAAAGEAIGPEVDLSPPALEARSPRVVIDDRGEALVGYLLSADGDGEGHPYTVVVRPFGEPVPQIAGPATAVTGRPVTFVARSPWAPLASAAWSWSDGAPGGSGSSISRTFTAPGTYTLTLSGSDAAGNESTASLTVSVVTPSSSSPPSAPARPAEPGTTAPLRLRLSRRARQRIGRTRAIVVTATCLGQPCTLRPSASVRLRRARGRRAQTIRVSGARRRAAAGRRVRLTIRIPRRTARRLIRAVGRRGLRATVTVRASGRTATVTRRVKVVLVR